MMRHLNTVGLCTRDDCTPSLRDQRVRWRFPCGNVPGSFAPGFKIKAPEGATLTTPVPRALEDELCRSCQSANVRLLRSFIRMLCRHEYLPLGLGHVQICGRCGRTQGGRRSLWS
jgi:hypothetical protein